MIYYSSLATISVYLMNFNCSDLSVWIYYVHFIFLKRQPRDWPERDITIIYSIWEIKRSSENKFKYDKNNNVKNWPSPTCHVDLEYV